MGLTENRNVALARSRLMMEEHGRNIESAGSEIADAVLVKLTSERLHELMVKINGEMLFLAEYLEELQRLEGVEPKDQPPAQDPYLHSLLDQIGSMMTKPGWQDKARTDITLMSLGKRPLHLDLDKALEG